MRLKWAVETGVEFTTRLQRAVHGRAPSKPLSTAGSMPTRKPRRPPLIQMRGSTSTLACTYTGMAFFVPKGEVPPTR